MSLEFRTIKLRVWDLPTRVFHWALALCIVALIISGMIGGDAMEWHLKFGYCALSLLVFRIVWGFIGGHWSRFKQFLYSPLTILDYMRGITKHEHEVGHNPLGSLSVWGLLMLVVVQVGTGLMSDDEIATQGPLAKFVSSTTSGFATSYHKHWGKWVLIALVTLHIIAVLYYLAKKKKNLIRPMILGDKLVDGAQVLAESKDTPLHRLGASVVFAAIAFTVAYCVKRLS